MTADSLQVSTFSDPGFQGRLGLNQELFDTADAFTSWCNEHGGIHGRKIVLEKRDAKLAEYQQRVIEACDQGDFFMVGGGAVFDDTGQQDRLACGLPAIPGYVVTPAAIEADLSIQPVPIPNNEDPLASSATSSTRSPRARTRSACSRVDRDHQARRRPQQGSARDDGRQGRLRRHLQPGRRNDVAAVPRSHAQRGREGPVLRRRPRGALVVPCRGCEPRRDVRLGRRRSEQLRPRGARRRPGRGWRLHAHRVLPVPRS